MNSWIIIVIVVVFMIIIVVVIVIVVVVVIFIIVVVFIIAFVADPFSFSFTLRVLFCSHKRRETISRLRPRPAVDSAPWTAPLSFDRLSGPCFFDFRSGESYRLQHAVTGRPVQAGSVFVAEGGNV